jgi:hypothetical protein
MDSYYNKVGPDGEVTLRFAFPDDESALTRLAALDSAEPLAQPVLLAEVGGELRAAVSLADGAAIADPFYFTLAVMELLRARAKQLGGDGTGRRSSASHRRLGLRTWARPGIGG